uniref:CHCH domain-containing protein n=1 Tax=Mesocestoides corti TaxID=53468 RepID=A0A5K3FKG6_MESCO
MPLDRRETRDWLRPGGPTCLCPNPTPHHTTLQQHVVMKLADVLFGLYKRSSRRRHDLEYFKFKYYKDPLLKNKVSGKGEKEPQMALMLACLKSNDFEEKPCSQVIDAFNKCVVAAEARRTRNKEARRMGHFSSESDDPEESSRLSSIQINRVLRKFPEP